MGRLPIPRNAVCTFEFQHSMTIRLIFRLLAPFRRLVPAASPRLPARPPARVAGIRRPAPSLSPHGTARLPEAYDRWLDELESTDDVAGLATAVIADGHVAYERTLGYADVARRHQRMTPNTVFRIASLSKAFASALAGLLVENGRPALEYPAGRRAAVLRPQQQWRHRSRPPSATSLASAWAFHAIPTIFCWKPTCPTTKLARELDQVGCAARWAPATATRTSPSA